MNFRLVLPSFFILLAACSPEPGQQEISAADTPAIPDSIPQMVRLGKEADWAFKPDTMMNDLLLGDKNCMKQYMFDNGSNGSVNGKRQALPYINAKQNEKLTVFTTNVNNRHIPYAFRLQRVQDLSKKDMDALNYTTELNFVSSHGIYIGMPLDYVQSIYKSQPMMKWIKGDTTYLSYTPGEKDKSHYQRYPYTDYSALYKFVNDQCRMIEMNVRPEVFEAK